MSIVDVKRHIHECLSKVLSSLGLETNSVRLDPSKISELGDISSGVALSLAKSVKKPPMELAEEIQGQIKALRSVGRCDAVDRDPEGPEIIHLQKEAGEQVHQKPEDSHPGVHERRHRRVH